MGLEVEERTEITSASELRGIISSMRHENITTGMQRDGNITLNGSMSMSPQVLRQYLKEEREARRGDQLPAALTEREAALEVQNQRSTPAAAVRPGTVIGSAAFQSSDRGTTFVRIIHQGDHLTMSAITDRENTPIANQAVSATITLDGQRQQLRLQSDDMGRIPLPNSPANTPSGPAQSGHGAAR